MKPEEQPMVVDSTVTGREREEEERRERGEKLLQLAGGSC